MKFKAPKRISQEDLEELEADFNFFEELRTKSNESEKEKTAKRGEKKE